MDYYQLHRNFWDFAFNNPEKIKPGHCALFSFAIEHCNRLGWREKFGFPSQMAMDAVGIKCYASYLKIFNDLIDFGFFDLVEKSKNQYSANIIALSNFDEANNKALDRAIIKHATKQHKSTIESTIESTNKSTSSIIRLNTNIQIYQEQINQFNSKNKILILELFESEEWVNIIAMQNKIQIDDVLKWIIAFGLKLETEMDYKLSKKDFVGHFSRWLPGELVKSKNVKRKDQDNNDIPDNHPSRKRIA